MSTSDGKSAGGAKRARGARQIRSADSLAAATGLPTDLGDRLLAWYRENGRDLPWRHTDDPYAILVSELMLQQTRVETVLDRYGRFLERFPDFATLAAVDVEDVLAEWSGLGYYRRARSLHALARIVVEENGGRLPDDLDALLALPGIGPYTAAAVASICFGLPELAVDGNIARALCRLGAIEEDPKKSSTQRQLRKMTAPLLAVHTPGDLNQALMELGARVCLPRSPRCGECPVAEMCAARWLGIESQIPPTRRQPVIEVREEALLAESGSRYFLVRGQRPGVLQDMWEFPTLDSRLHVDSLDEYVRENGWPLQRGELLGEIQHGITSRRITCSIYRGQAQPASESVVREAASSAETGWFTVEEIAALPLAASARKAFAHVLGIDLTRS